MEFVNFDIYLDMSVRFEHAYHTLRQTIHYYMKF